MVSKRLFKDLDNDPQPSTFLETMVAEGRTGIKSGKGFYNWTPDNIASTIKKRDEHLLKILKEERG
jgi:3-hydroxybutyryl-CoA dehydrogenase